MANKFTEGLSTDVDKAAAEINALGIKGVSAKVTKKKRTQFTQKHLAAIKKAREQLKE